MTKTRALIAAISVGLLLLIATSAFTVVTWINQSDAQNEIRSTQQDLVAAVAEIRHDEQSTAASEKAQTVQRVDTIASRCELTHLLLQNGLDTPEFRQSYATCLMQLAAIRKLAGK